MRAGSAAGRERRTSVAPPAAHARTPRGDAPSTGAHARPAAQERKPAGRARRVVRIVLFVLLVLLVALAAVAIFTEQWLFNTWAALSLDEIIFHLRMPLTGTNTDMIFGYLTSSGLAELCVVAVAILLLVLTRRRPVLLHAIVAGLLAGSLCAIAVAALDFDERVGFTSYTAASALADDEEGGFIEENYANPLETRLEFPERKRNLVYIYLESMETTFSDTDHGGAFTFNAIPELTQLAQDNEDFSGSDARLDGGIALPGATWTSGAMFSQTSGVPLKVSLDESKVDTYDRFFPSLVTLGDILELQGYRQALLIGSEASFGGRDFYFAEHGGFEIMDYDYAVARGWIPRGYWEFWGYEDARLFENAKTVLAELAAGDEPFNLTMLTVDTHFEDGYVCDLCEREFGDDQYSNVMACSSRQVAAFVKWMSEQDFFEDTTIVISGDHPTMDKDYCADVPEDYQRRVYTAVVNGAVDVADPQQRREYSTFDLFPTTLAAMGVQIEGDRLGLGANLFSGEPTIIERYGIAACEEEVAKPSRFLEELSRVEDDNITKVLEAIGRGPSSIEKLGWGRARGAASE